MHRLPETRPRELEHTDARLLSYSITASFNVSEDASNGLDAHPDGLERRSQTTSYAARLRLTQVASGSAMICNKSASAASDASTSRILGGSTRTHRKHTRVKVSLNHCQQAVSICSRCVTHVARPLRDTERHSKTDALGLDESQHWRCWAASLSLATMAS